MSYVVFNPYYQLRQDGNRVILYGNENNDYQSEDWFSFIHPYHAIMFSFFKGTKCFDEEVKDFADYFSLSIEESKNIAKSYINKSRKEVYSKGNIYYFPKNVLLEVEVPMNCIPNNYTANDFIVDGEPDMMSFRTLSPVAINLELTMKCFVDCCYCYANRAIQDSGQMSTAEVINLIRDAKASGVLSFDINGGEVLLHPGIYDIVSELHDCGYKPLISTKIPVTANELAKLKQCGVTKFQLSLDSVNDEILTRMVKAKSGYVHEIEKTLSAAVPMQLKVDINVVLTKYNSNPTVVIELLDFLNRFPCIDSVRFNVCGYAIYKGSKNYYKIRPSQSEIDVIEQFIRSDLSNKYPFSIRMSGYEKRCYYEIPEERKRAFEERAICTGNLRNMVILPNGDVTICEELYANPHFIIGNVLKSSINEIWNSEKALALFYAPCGKSSKSLCHTCDDYSNCRSRIGVCWKSVLMAYGEENWDYPDPRCPKAPLPFNEIYIR